MALHLLDIQLVRDADQSEVAMAQEALYVGGRICTPHIKIMAANF
jgi:hypothetical protein